MAEEEPCRRCMVKNCQEEVGDEGVTIGDKLLCKSCAVYYLKGKFSFLG